MISTPSNYWTIQSDLGHFAETKIVVGNTTYGEDAILSCERSQSIFADRYSIGNTVMNQIRFSLIGVAPENLPRMSRVEVWTKLWMGDRSDSTSWVPMGVYYTDKPEYDPETGVIEVMGYDEMFRTSVVPFETGSTVSAWDNPLLSQVVQHLGAGTTFEDVLETNFAGIGLPIESVERFPSNATMPSIPYDYTVREILSEIAMALCGNWTIVFKDNGDDTQHSELRLIRNIQWRAEYEYEIVDDEEIAHLIRDWDLGRDITNFTKGDDIPLITHVYVNYGYDSDGVLLSGEAVSATDNGRTVEYETHIFTDGTTANTIASRILSNSDSSIVYAPYTASGVPLSIYAELGDTVTVNEVDSVLGSITCDFGKGMWAEISAPGIPMDDDFMNLLSTSREAQRIERSTEVNSARISVNAGNIELEASRAKGVEAGLSSRITVNANNIESKVSAGEIISTINQSAESVTINASKVNLQGYVTFTNLSTAGQTTINGGNVTTGSLSANRISGGTLKLGGANNGNGVLEIYNASNVKIGTWDKDRILIYDNTTSTSNAETAKFAVVRQGDSATSSYGAFVGTMQLANSVSGTYPRECLPFVYLKGTYDYSTSTANYGTTYLYPNQLSLFDNSGNSVSIKSTSETTQSPVTRTSGWTIASQTMKRWGKMVQLTLTFNMASSGTGYTGNRAFNGTLSNYKPASIVTGAGFLTPNSGGSHSFGGYINTNGEIVIAYQDDVSFAGGSAYISFTYLMA